MVIDQPIRMSRHKGLPAHISLRINFDDTHEITLVPKAPYVASNYDLTSHAPSSPDARTPDLSAAPASNRLSTATTDSPATTRSPGVIVTVISSPAGSTRSTCEPRRITPIRCPSATSWP